MNLQSLLLLAAASGSASAQLWSLIIAGVVLMISLAGALKCLGLASSAETRKLPMAALSIVLAAVAIASGLVIAKHYTPVPRRTMQAAGATKLNAADDAEVIALAVRSDKTEATQRIRSLNFSFTPLDESWVKLDATRVRYGAQLAYANNDPRSTFMIVAQRGDSGLTLDDIAETVATNLYAERKDAHVGNRQPMTVGDLRGINVEATFGSGAYGRKVLVWATSHGGFVYQLITDGNAADAEVLEDRHRAMLGGFTISELNRIVYAGGVRGVTEFESEHYGYRINLSGDPWHVWPSGDPNLAGGQFRAALHQRAAIGIFPLYLPDIDPSLDDLSAAFARMIVDYDESMRTDVTPAPAGEGEGVSFGYQTEEAGGVMCEHRFRIVRHDRRAVMIVTYANDPPPQLLAAMERALESFELYDKFEPSNAVGNKVQKATRGFVLNQLGLESLVERRWEAGLLCFEEARKLNPTNDVFLENLLITLMELKRDDEAMRLLEERLAEGSAPEGLRVAHAKLLGRAGDAARSREAWEQLFRDGYANERDLAALIAVQLEANDHAAAMATVESFMRVKPSYDVQRWKGQILTHQGKHEEAISYFKLLLAAHPGDVLMRLDLAKAHEEAEQYEAALAIADELLAEGNAIEPVHLLRGRCHLCLKSHEEAKQSFELALATNPHSEDAQHWVTLASGIMGQGNTTLVKTPIEPVAIPAEIEQRLAGIPAEHPLGGDHGAVEIYRIKGFDYKQGQHWRETTYRKVKIVGQQGVDRFGSLDASFNPMMERVYVNRLAVYDETGALAAEGKPEDYYLSSDDGSDMATGEQTLHIPAPMIKPGYTLEFTISREYLGGLDEFGFERVVLASDLPMQVAAVFVAGDVDKLAFTSTGPAAREGASGPLRYWGVSDPPLYAVESRQPAIEDFLPVVHISDAAGDWQRLGVEYCRKIADRLAPDAAAAKAAQEAAGNLATREEKIAAIARYVQKEINYQALEFGVRGQIPNTPARTLETGYGDCKDHSLLLKQMLEAVGVPAQLALVNSSNRTDPQLPTTDQFDHMVVSVPGPTGGDEGRLFLDCTSKHLDAGLALTSDFDTALKHALVLDPLATRLATIPARPVDWMNLRCSRDVTIVLDDAGGETAHAIVREQVVLSPMAASGIRGGLSAIEPREHKSVIARMLSEQERINITSLAVENVDAVSEPLVLNLEYRVDDAFHRTADDGRQFVGRLPAIWESWYAYENDAAERITPFRLWSGTVTATSRVVAPAGYSAVRAFEPQRSQPGNEFVTWSVEGDATAATRSAMIQTRAGYFSPGEYATYRGEMKHLLNTLRRPITLERNSP